MNGTHSDEASNNGEKWLDLPRLPFISNPFRQVLFFYPIVSRLTIADQRPRFRISIHRTLLEDGAPVDSSDPSFVQLLGTSRLFVIWRLPCDYLAHFHDILHHEVSPLVDVFRQCASMSHSVDAKMVAIRRIGLELGQWRSLRKASCPSARHVAAQTTGSVEQTAVALVVRVLGEQNVGLRIAAETANSVR